MKRPECPVDNREGAKFCNECGYDLRKNTDLKSIQTKELDFQVTETHPEVHFNNGAIRFVELIRQDR